MNQQAVKIGILATLFLGGFVAADEAEDSAVAVVMKMGGKFTRDQKAPWRPVIGVNLERSKVTDAELESLGALEQLRKLWLNDTKVTDTGLKHLAPLKQLKELYANKTKITDSGLKHLANLEPLQMLSLEGNGLTDEGMKTLATFGQLQKLWLSDNPLTDAGIKELTALTQLNTLWLSRSKLTDAGLKHIAALVNLKELGFSSTQITDAGLKNLASLKKLQDLNLFRNKVTDAGLKDLAVLTGLRKLELTGTDVTEAGLLDLMKALPGCQIVSPLTKNNPQKELSIVFYHDFRKQTIPDKLTKYQFQEDITLRLDPEGARITIPKSAKHALGGVGFVTAFGLKGDFEVTTSFEILAADSPLQPKDYGVGFSLYAEKADGVAVIISRMTKPGDKQIILSVAESVGSSSVPCTDKMIRMRLQRIGDIISYYWAPGLVGDNFKKIKEVPFDKTDIKRVKVVALNGRTSSNIDVRLFDITVRGEKESNPTAAVQLRVPADGQAKNSGKPGAGSSGGGIAAALIIGLVVTLAAAGGVWFYVRRRRRAGAAPAADAEPVSTNLPEAISGPISFKCSHCEKKLKVKAKLAGKRIKCPQCATAVSVPG